MRALVLGSSGQIGSHLVDYLRSEGDEVIEWDIELDLDMDLRVPNPSLTRELTLADFVYFLAFDVGGSTYLKEYQGTFDFLDNNSRLMTRVFAGLEATGTPFIFTSSQMSKLNHSPYGILKRLGEFYTESLNGINVRFWNIYGRETDEKKFHVITDFIKMALNNGNIRMMTTGEEERDFVHADDCCRALRMLATGDVDTSKTYDIASGEWISIDSIAYEIAKAIPYTTIEKGTGTDTVQGEIIEPNRNMFDLGWKPEIDIKEGILGLIDEHTRN